MERRARIRNVGFPVLLAAGLFALGGCSVAGDGDTVSVDHPAHQLYLGQIGADEFCAKSGKTARHLQTSPARGDTIVFLTRTSVFACEGS